MKYTIRELCEKDFDFIRELYEDIYSGSPEKYKTTGELKWLFSDPEIPGKLNGFVAFNNNGKLIGTIGYTLNIYVFGNLRVTGVIPFSWMVLNEHRGILGIQLLLKVIKLGDFAFAIEGSELAKVSYKAVKLNYMFKARVYQKVLSPLRYSHTSGKSNIRQFVKGMYFYGIRSSQSLNSQENFDLIESNDLPTNLTESDLCFKFVENQNRISWLVSCPLVEAHQFSIIENGSPVGFAVCYIKHFSPNVIKGRIVHVSYLGKDINHWINTLVLLEDYLISKGCCSISVLASNPVFIQSLKLLYYKATGRSDRSVYIRDDRSLLVDIPLTEWHLTYAESDKGYRDI